MEGTQDPARAEKERLRAEYRRRRAALGDDGRRRASREIAARLLALPEVDGAELVHLYWPADARHEVDTRPVLSALEARGVRVALPVVTSAHGAPPRLSHRLHVPGAMAPGRFGVMEPVGTLEIDASEVDVAIVPALGADRAGTRLGYGGGFYDAFLDGAEYPVVCPVFDTCLADALPREAHDRPVDIVVTETRVLRI